MFSGPFKESIIKRAVEKKLIEINLVNLRDFGLGSHELVDDKPYGGGVGMVMRVDIVERAISEIILRQAIRPELRPRAQAFGSEDFDGELSRTAQARRDDAKLCRSIINHKSEIINQKVVLLDPAGRVFNQKKAKQFSRLDHLILVCGHYEGIDARIEKFVDEVISIGDYILTGGEIPAMVVVDSVVRLLPGVLVKPEAVKIESFSKLASQGETLRGWQALVLEYPQYTRPEEYKGFKVPKILLSGNHREIEKWRQNQAILRTKKRRPDLLSLK